LDIDAPNVDDRHAEAVEETDQRVHSVEIYVLVINRVEPRVVVDVDEIAYLKYEHSVVLEQDLDSAHEVVEIVDVCTNVVGRDDGGRPVLGEHAARQRRIEKIRDRRYALGSGFVRNLGGGIDAENAVA